MPAARKAASDGKVLATTPLSYDGKAIPADADLREVLPAEVLEACLERGEAKRS